MRVEREEGKGVPVCGMMSLRKWSIDRSGGGKCARSLALAYDVELLISELESAAGGDD